MIIDGKKFCPKCSENKIAIEHFYKSSGSKDGFGGYCKKCANETSIKAAKDLKEKNPEKVKKKWKESYDRRRDKILEYKKEYHKENREKNNLRTKKWREENHEPKPIERKANPDDGKICPCCQEKKDFSEYNSNKTTYDKLGAYCKSCSSEKAKIYRKENLEKVREEDRKKYYENREFKIKQKREYNSRPEVKQRQKEWVKENRERLYAYERKRLEDPEIRQKIRERENNRFRNDPILRLKRNMRSGVHRGLKNGKSKSTEEYIGCTIQELKDHLESQFTEGMTWDNYGKPNGEIANGWEIDHIIPLNSAQTEQECIELMHYTNLQPLWRELNNKKRYKLDWEHPEDYLPPFLKD